jgi:hypothetical protein
MKAGRSVLGENNHKQVPLMQLNFSLHVLKLTERASKN